MAPRQQEEPRSLGRYRSEKKPPTELERQWRTAGKDLDGLNRLEALVQVLEHMTHVYEEAIGLARKQEYTWEEIAEVFGVTKQSAWERFRDIDGDR